MFIGSLIAIPWIIGRLPKTFFLQHRAKVEQQHKKHPALAIIIFMIRNILGIVFIIAGIAMLFLPGQGIITIVIGITFMDFPKKHCLINKILQNNKVRQSLNWIRAKENKADFEF